MFVVLKQLGALPPADRRVVLRRQYFILHSQRIGKEVRQLHSEYDVKQGNRFRAGAPNLFHPVEDCEFDLQKNPIEVFYR